MPETDTQAGAELAVVKRVELRGTPESAFRKFTDEVASWWPMATHSVGETETETVVIESGEGGRVYERLRDGTEHDWGRVVTWEPPGRFAMTWHPGRDPESAGLVEIEFRPSGTGTTLHLRHTGWEKLGDEAEEMVRGYDAGWEGVLHLFTSALG